MEGAEALVAIVHHQPSLGPPRPQIEDAPSSSASSEFKTTPSAARRIAASTSTSNSTTANSSSQIPDNFRDHIAFSIDNRIFTCTIMSSIGVPVEDCVEPLHLAHAVLGALIGHASLYFTGRLLQRDISSSNVLYSKDPIDISTFHHLLPPPATRINRRDSTASSSTSTTPPTCPQQTATTTKSSSPRPCVAVSLPATVRMEKFVPEYSGVKPLEEDGADGDHVTLQDVAREWRGILFRVRIPGEDEDQGTDAQHSQWRRPLYAIQKASPGTVKRGCMSGARLSPHPQTSTAATTTLGLTGPGLTEKPLEQKPPQKTSDDRKTGASCH
ncbi:hypothetical protein DFH27DRAFT_617504 [Peziza echinospora]|nr:hypothetical protein DFH27DRAFT_617504 [Peziza echinospora]